MEVEVIPPMQEDRGPGVRITHLRSLGVIGAALAILTMLAAFSVGLVVLFGTTLLCALIVWAAWPAVFSPEFTQFVFGDPQVRFWKLFLLFLAAGAVLKMLRRYIRQR